MAFKWLFTLSNYLMLNLLRNFPGFFKMLCQTLVTIELCHWFFKNTEVLRSLTSYDCPNHHQASAHLLSLIVYQTSPTFVIPFSKWLLSVLIFQTNKYNKKRLHKAKHKKFLVSKRVRLFERKKQKTAFLHSMIENDCSRQSKNQRGESLSLSLLKQIFNVSGGPASEFNSWGSFLLFARRQVDHEGFV